MTLAASTLFAGSSGGVDPAEEARFYRSLKMRNGTFKTTRPHRFDDINPQLMDLLRTRVPGAPKVLDVGVSTGISTVELVAAFRAAGLAPAFTATDLYLAGHLVRLGGGLTVLTDRRGWPLQYEMGGRVMRPWLRRLDFLTLAVLPRALLNAALAPRVGKVVRAGKGTPVALVTRAVSDDPGIRLVEDDILVPRPEFQGGFDFIRVANILNAGTFPTTALRTARDNVLSYLRGPGSCLLVTRTSHKDDTNAGTLFERNEDGTLGVVQRFGGGSEIESLFTQV